MSFLFLIVLILFQTNFFTESVKELASYRYLTTASPKYKRILKILRIIIPFQFILIVVACLARFRHPGSVCSGDFLNEGEKRLFKIQMTYLLNRGEVVVIFILMQGILTLANLYLLRYEDLLYQ